MRSISCALISLVTIYVVTHNDGTDRFNITIKEIFLFCSFVFLILAILFMIFGL